MLVDDALLQQMRDNGGAVGDFYSGEGNEFGKPVLTQDGKPKEKKKNQPNTQSSDKQNAEAIRAARLKGKKDVARFVKWLERVTDWTGHEQVNEKTEKTSHHGYTYDNENN